MDNRFGVFASRFPSKYSLKATQAPGIYHGNLNFEATSDDMIDAAQLLPYPAQATDSEYSEIPESIALTEFHFILLYKDRIAGICNLDDKLTYEEPLPLVSLAHILPVSPIATRCF